MTVIQLISDVIESVKTTITSLRGLYILAALLKITPLHAVFHTKIQIAPNSIRILIFLQTVL